MPPETMNDEQQAPPILSGSRHGFYVTRRETTSATERWWPWMLVTAAILASLAAMAR